MNTIFQKILIAKDNQAVLSVKRAIKVKGKINYYLLVALILGALPTAVQAQPIIPANDGTNTVVNPQGDRFDITGGQISGDGANLFHSFAQFGLDSNQTANFISNPTIQNILSRVTGGNPSVINGLIQVTGGTSNLFLLNPAGIVFGQNASLNVPASFIATTATSIGFGDNEFKSNGQNNYATLIGTPNTLSFAQTPAAIVNAGQLAVPEGANLALVGGTVVSTGDLKAPGGQLLVEAVPGQSMLRLSQPGYLLSLEVPSTSAITPLSLPQLLTGSVQTPGVRVNGGQVELSGTGIPVENGDVVVRSAIAQTATLSAQHNLTLVESQLQTTGNLNLLALDTVRVRDSVANPFLAKAEGNLYIQGNQSIDILALNHLQTPFQSGGDLNLVSDGSIYLDAHFNSGGNFSLRKLSGQPASFISLYDPIITVTGDYTADSYSGPALKVQAGGDITYTGSISITGPDTAGTIPTTDPDYETLTSTAALILGSTNGNISVGGTIKTFDQNDNGGPVILSARGNITTAEITAEGRGQDSAGYVSITSTDGNITTGTITTTAKGQGNGGNVTLSAPGRIEYGDIDAQANGQEQDGTIRITAGTETLIKGPEAQPSTPGFEQANARGTTIVLQSKTPPETPPETPPVTPITPVPSSSSSVSTTPVSSSTSSGSLSTGGSSTNTSTSSNNTGSSTTTSSSTDTTNNGGSSAEPSQTTTEGQGDMASTPSSTDAEAALMAMRDESFTRQFEQHFRYPTKASIKTLSEARTILHNVEEATGVKPALIYVTFVPPTLAGDGVTEASSLSSNSSSSTDNSQYSLELLLVTSEGSPVRKQVEGTTREQVIKVANEFRLQVTNVRSDETVYLPPAQQLYDWMVAPLEADLKARGIQNLVFMMDTGLRSIPLAALHNSQEFLIEKYSIGLMPSLSLSDTRYTPVKNLEVLAMGMAKFTDQKPLPAVPVELSAITPSLWQGKSFLNDTFTLENLKGQRQRQPFGIIHLATHANFQPGEPSNSYIQLWDSKLRLNQLSELGWNNPPVELLVLSACRTALGNEQAELGFAGLAVQAGAKSALGSLWYVSDQGTLALMTQLYEQLKQAPIKAEALRQAQLAMLKGQVYVEGGQLVAANKSIALPPELAKLRNQDFKHPYFWSAFTMIGTPW